MVNKSIFLITSFFSLLAATACAEDTTKPSPDFNPLKCLGTEPFWALDLQQSNITLENLDGPQGQYKLATVTLSSNHTNRWFVTANNDKNEQAISLALTKSNQCSDDMSDYNYQYDVMVIQADGQLLTGCCNRINTTK